MKKLGMNAMGLVACLALAVAIGWSALPTSAAGDACPLKSAKSVGAEAKAGTCNASRAAAGTCSKSATNASLTKGEGSACSSAKNASLAKDEKSGCCADKAAAPAVNTDGTATPAVKLAADKSGDCGECPLAKAAKQAANGEAACDGKNIAKLVQSDSRFTTLALAVKAAGMEGEFQCPLQKTVLAPTNEAFQKIPAEQWAAILQDDAKLKALVANHIIKGAAMKSGCLTEAKTAKSAFGSDLAVSQCPVSGKVSVNNAGIVGDALVASNGNVLALDNVLMPADMQVAKAEVAAAEVQVAAAK